MQRQEEIQGTNEHPDVIKNARADASKKPFDEIELGEQITVLHAMKWETTLVTLPVIEKKDGPSPRIVCELPDGRHAEFGLFGVWTQTALGKHTK